MARKTLKAQREERAALVRLHAGAQDGVDETAAALRDSRKTLARLELPVGYYTNLRHGHEEPYAETDCGWCSNIRRWRGTVRSLEAVLVLAGALEDDARELSRGLTQSAFWEAVKDKYPHMRRDLARELHRSAKKN